MWSASIEELEHEAARRGIAKYEVDGLEVVVERYGEVAGGYRYHYGWRKNLARAVVASILRAKSGRA